MMLGEVIMMLMEVEMIEMAVIMTRSEFNDKDHENVHLGTKGVLGFELKELGHIVEKGEEDDGQNVTKTIPNAALILKD